jgi:hypothetical protein
MQLLYQTINERRTMQTQTMNKCTDYWTITANAAMNMICSSGNVGGGGNGRPITIRRDDGLIYRGYVNEHGEKHGQGTLTTDVCITGTVGDPKSHMQKWTEFTGSWCNGLMHGYGVMRHMSERGVECVVHDGMWDNGVPVITKPVLPHNSGIRLTPQMRRMKSINHKFGLCSRCDNGIDDEYDFGDITESICAQCWNQIEIIGGEEDDHEDDHEDDS